MLEHKIIIDTDIGDDIDDALAIAFALNCPELKIIGITTVFKNTHARARIARKLLTLAGRDDIPVYAGYGQPIIERVDTSEIPCQYSKDMDEIEFNRDMDAVDYIIDTLMKSDNDITLVPIGPLTNIALALTRQPEIKNKIKEIVLMGGAYFIHFNEWNIVCDPEAAKIVFDSGVKIKAVGLDVTTRCKMSEKDTARFFEHGGAVPQFIAQLLLKWRIMHKCMSLAPMLHDPLAVCAVFDDTYLKFKRQDIFVELKGEHTRGVTFNKYTLWGPKPEANIWVATSVDSKGFTGMFTERIFS